MENNKKSLTILFHPLALLWLIVYAFCLPLDILYYLPILVDQLKFINVPKIYWLSTFYIQQNLFSIIIFVISLSISFFICSIITSVIKKRFCLILYNILLFNAFSLGLHVLLMYTKKWLEMIFPQLISLNFMFNIAIIIIGPFLSGLIVYFYHKGKVGWSSNLYIYLKKLNAGLITICLLSFILNILLHPRSLTSSHASGNVNSEIKTPIIMITVDALSALHLPMYGYGRMTSPKLAEFSNESTVFLQNYSNSNWTYPGIASILYGQRPWHYVGYDICYMSASIIKFHQYALPAILQRNGYYTISVVTNFNAFPSMHNLQNYFNEYYEIEQHYYFSYIFKIRNFIYTKMKSTIGFNLILEQMISIENFITHLINSDSSGGHANPERPFEIAKEVIEGNKAKPFFIWIHLFRPHDPYLTPPIFVGKFNPSGKGRTVLETRPPLNFEAHSDPNFPGYLLDRYDESISYVDFHIGQFIDWLKNRGLYNKSIIIITSDHGESFHRLYGGHGGPLLHEELIRIPLLIKFPSQKTQKKIYIPTEQVDILPTILDYLEGNTNTLPYEGKSLLKIVNGDKIDDNLIFSMCFNRIYSKKRKTVGSIVLIHKGWKYVHYFGYDHYSEIPTLHDELYNLEESLDLDERNNLIGKRPDIAYKLLHIIKGKIS